MFAPENHPLRGSAIQRMRGGARAMTTPATDPSGFR